MARARRLLSWRISEVGVAVRRKYSKLSIGVIGGLSVLGTQACVLSFDDYPEGDVCGRALDAGILASTAPDPVLRGCDAGTSKMAKPDRDPDASQGPDGSSGMGGSP